jgi:hypothetical protein
MQNSPYYVLLTGDKSNAGDHLIKESAITLLSKFRTDREVIPMAGWKKLDEENLSIINQSIALILCGGPSVRMHLYGDVYPLTENLDDIKVPIIMLGAGYRDSNGEWEATTHFEFSAKTHQLLAKINESGYLSSVRCYHTLNALRAHGYDQFIMSGCPAFYELGHLSTPFAESIHISKIAFATGRKYLTLPGMDQQQIDLILFLSEKFKGKQFSVAFHDPIHKHKAKTHELITTLEKHNIPYHDISGSAQNLRDFYNGVDAQIGYRVHSHIFMSSVQKPSILLAEDSRGKGIRTSMPGVILNAYEYQPLHWQQRLINRLSNKNIYFAASPLKDVQYDVWRQWEDEEKNNWKRNRVANHAIQEHFQTMRRMILQLP